MKKYIFFTSFLILLVFLYLFFGQKLLSTLSPKKEYNLLIISIDTLRADHMGVYGYEKNTTPNIDKWAKDAVVFNNAFVETPQTYPSMSSFLTGKDSSALKIFNNSVSNPLPQDTTTLAKILKKNDYQTEALVENHALHNDITNLGMGFDKYIMINRGNPDQQDNISDLTNQTYEFLENHQNEKFFLWIHLMDPHTPYYPQEKYRCLFNANYCQQINDLTSDELNKRRESKAECQLFKEDNNNLEIQQTLYDGEIAQADNRVGQILEKIRSLNIDKKTIILFIGDHGEGFDHNYYYNHGQVLYHSSIRVPLILHYPDKYPAINNSLITNSDVLPTVLDLLKIKYSKNAFDGLSFADLFSNFPLSLISQAKNHAFTYHVNRFLNKFAVFDGRYKYISSLNSSCKYNSQNEELYDLKNDPDELNNLINSKASGSYLKSVLDQYRKAKDFGNITPKIIKDYTEKEKIFIDKLKSLGY